MISRIIRKTVDLSKVQKLDQLEGPLYQLENGGHTFEITCMMGELPAMVSGTVSARFLRADGVTEYFTGTLSGSIASVTLPQACYNVNGRFGMVVFIAGSGVTSAVYAVAGSVYKSTSDDVMDPQNEVPNLEALMGIIGDCEDATEDAQAAAAFVPNVIAPAYAEGTPYSAGDYITDSGKLYRVTADITAANNSSLNAVSKVQVTAGGEIGDVKSRIPNKTRGLFNAIYGNNDVPAALEDFTINGSGVWATPASNHVIIPINPGDSIDIQANDDYNAYIAFLSADDKPSSTISAPFATGETGRRTITKGTTEDYTAPNNALYLYVAYSSGTGGNVYYPESIKINGIECALNVVKYFEQKTETNATAISNIETKVDEMSDAFVTGFANVNLNNITGVTKSVGYNASVNQSPVSVYIQSSSNYDTYCFYMSAGQSLYFPDSSEASYISIAVGTNPSGTWRTNDGKDFMECSTAVRYRKSDNNLPGVSNALVFTSDVLLAVTVSTGTSVTVAMTKLVLNPDLIPDIPEITVPKPKYRYVSETGEDSSTERLEFILPTPGGYVKYNFVHTVNAGINANVWRMARVYKSDESFTDGATIIETGEWECAVKIIGKNDFSGGYQHGDEVLTDAITILVDGAEVSIQNAPTIPTEFERIEIIETTALYEPVESGTSTTVVANHGSAHIFTKDGVTIKQSVIWSGQHTLSNCYLSMLPAAQSAFTKLYTDKTYEIITLGNDFTVVPTIKTGTLFGNGCTAKITITEYPALNARGNGNFQCQKNNGTTYFKCYFAVTKDSSDSSQLYTCSANEQWRAQTDYRITY